ncbi:MAG: cyclase family protein [Planctomycetes bacterium]|nr:cyclase family protein [Planctomycetota bacterium]
MKAQKFPRPSYRELLALPGQPPGTSWGVFRSQPERGTLNFINPAMVLRAAQSVQRGEVYPLNWELTQPHPSLFHRRPCKHVFFHDAVSTDDYLDQFYLQGSSHWDALCHVHHPERGHYLGLKKIVSPGANPIGIDQLAKLGIAGRGVLVDLERHLQRQGRALRPLSRDPIRLEDLQAALADQGAILEEGDILLLRTGWIGCYRADAAFRREVAREPRIPGLSGVAAFAEFLWNAGVAALGCDNPTVEVYPFESDTDNLHFRLVVNLGMPLAEMLDLDRLAEACHGDRRYHFLFAAAPLNLPGGAGSPANALAIR